MKTILVDAVNTFVVNTPEGFKINEAMHTLLDSFAERKIILTNANDEQMQTFGLDAMPYDVFTLKHNPDKPDPTYFKTMLTQLGLEADECVYFEHNPDAVKSAKTCNIQTYHYDPDTKDLAALSAYLHETLS